MRKSFLYVKAEPLGNGTGLFTFRNLPYGEYVIEVTCPGFVTYYWYGEITKNTTKILSAGIDWAKLGKEAPAAYPGDGVVRLVPGDVNGDALVDQRDVTALNATPGTFEDLVLNPAGKWYNNPAQFAKYDVNADGVIDAKDLAMVTTEYFGFNQQFYNDTTNMLNSTGVSRVALLVSKDTTRTQQNTFEMGQIYQPGQTFMIPGNVTMTAQWNAIPQSQSDPQTGGTVIPEATGGQTGGQVNTQTGVQVKHQTSGKTSPQAGGKASPQTGDENQNLLWWLLGSTALLTCGILALTGMRTVKKSYNR